MKLHNLIRQRKSLVLILFGLAAVFLVGTQVSLAFAKEEAKKMANEIGQLEMKTICVGRFLLDVPAVAQISYRRAFLEGWDIDSNVEETETAFAERLRATEEKHKAAKNGRGEPSLELVKAIDANGTFGKIFVYGRHWGYLIANGEKIHSSEATIDASVRIRGVSFDFAREIADLEDVPKLVRYISQLSPRPGNSIPNETGFCFDEGFLRDPLVAAETERVSVFIGLKGHPDVAIALNTMAGLKHEKTLLQRDAENTVKQSHLGDFKSLRTGPREINGIPGEEVLEVILEPNGTRGQSLMWESLPKQDSVYRPYLSLELNTGHGEPGTPVNSSLSDARALALWDRISASLRLRPTAPQPIAVEKPAMPLGSLGLASDKCLQSGWQCTDGSAATDIAVTSCPPQRCLFLSVSAINSEVLQRSVAPVQTGGLCEQRKRPLPCHRPVRRQPLATPQIIIIETPTVRRVSDQGTHHAQRDPSGGSDLAWG